MESKKGRALALDLMKDLLEDETQQVQNEKPKAPQNQAPKKPATPQVSSSESSAEKPTSTMQPLNLSTQSVIALPDPSDKTMVIKPEVGSADTNTKTKLHLTPDRQGPPQRAAPSNPVKPAAKPVAKPKPTTQKRAEPSMNRYNPESHAQSSQRQDALLAQGEELRFAQERIFELESELDRLRVENEQLAAAGETFRRKSDELTSKSDYLERQYLEVKDIAREEKQVLQNALATKEAEMGRLRMKIEELELRLATNLQKIRVRERELENRLELAKRESEALVRNKDEIALELKRQVDQLGIELENYRNKGQELNKVIVEKQELLRRTVKALRLALSMLESEDEQFLANKKVKP